MRRSRRRDYFLKSNSSYDNIDMKRIYKRDKEIDRSKFYNDFSKGVKRKVFDDRFRLYKNITGVDYNIDSERFDIDTITDMQEVDFVGIYEAENEEVLNLKKEILDLEKKKMDIDNKLKELNKKLDELRKKDENKLVNEDEEKLVSEEDEIEFRWFFEAYIKNSDFYVVNEGDDDLKDNINRIVNYLYKNNYVLPMGVFAAIVDNGKEQWFINENVNYFVEFVRNFDRLLIKNGLNIVEIGNFDNLGDAKKYAFSFADKHFERIKNVYVERRSLEYYKKAVIGIFDVILLVFYKYDGKRGLNGLYNDEVYKKAGRILFNVLVDCKNIRAKYVSMKSAKKARA
jgi:hypothetical protein